MHGFKFPAPVGRYILRRGESRGRGDGRLRLHQTVFRHLLGAALPKALTFLGKGIASSLSGEKKVGFLVRDVNKVEIEIGRVLPNQLQHLAPRMWDYARPGLSMA